VRQGWQDPGSRLAPRWVLRIRCLWNLCRR